ncbi:hypothetical protein [Thiocapsa sp. N5-Cardenillas]|uniref:hypothetical protein n=1 Tax=Thiocapsa sp. N5-Cardenillas TaxID=3137397 RepID=UPI0035B3BF6D
MANTTFTGPVRSQNGFQSISVNATTGAETVTGSFGFAMGTPAATGAGIEGTAAVYETSVSRNNGIVTTSIMIDLTGLNSGGTAGDIIGKDGAGAAYIGRVTAADSGTVFGVKMTCFEVPAGGDTDIDLYSATEATGVEDSAITALTETQIINSGTLALGTSAFGTDIAADQYLYLVGQGTSDAAYTAGRLLIEIYGYDA